MSTITEVVPGLGSPPLTTDPATFDTRADTLYGTSLPAAITSMNTAFGQANALAASMNSVAAGTATSIPYTFSTTTADADPGNGILRLDNATQNIATTIRADLVGSEGSTWTSLLDVFDDSTSTIKGFIMLMKSGDATKWLLFSVSALASPAGYKNITVANVASSAASPFADGDGLLLKFSRTGDKGDTGATGAAGVSGNVLTLATPVASTSGTSIDFAGLPTGCKRVTLMLSGVSTNGTDAYLVQIGPSGGVETTGYLGSGASLVNTSTVASTAYTAGLGVKTSSASLAVQGSIVFTKENSSNNTWIGSALLAHSAGNADIFVSATTKSLAGELDRIRITTVSGTDTFDAGEINITYEV